MAMAIFMEMLDSTILNRALPAIAEHLGGHFPDLVPYNRMVELKRDSFLPMAIYMKTWGLANCTGISFVDSTPFWVCDKWRINQHKVFKELAKRG